MAVNQTHQLSIVSGDGLSGNTNMLKSVQNLTYGATTVTNSFPTQVGAAPPAAPLPTTKLSVPGTVTPTPSGTGGTLAAATYYYKVTALNAAGETTGSAEANTTTSGTTSSVALAWTAIPGATSYRVYRGTVTGTQTLYYTTATNSYTDTGAASTAGTLPGSNTTGGSGSVAVGVYLLKFTYVSAPQGETTGGTESAPITALASSQLAIPSPAAYGSAAFYNVYITAAGGSTGTETLQNVSPIPIGTAYLQNAAISSGAALPGSNTTLTYTPTLAVSPTQSLYVRNTSTSAQTVAVTWTLQGGSSNKVLDLVQGAAITFLETSAGNQIGGITALSFAVSAPQTMIELSVAG